jgi:hypothetical protein
MSFRLIYEGELLSSNSGDKKAVRKNKHAIRRQLHPQLKRLWEIEKELRWMARSPVPGKAYGTDNPIAPDEGLQYLAKRHEIGGYGFIPLVGATLDPNREPEIICSLDILFLRREPPGAIIQGGDIDNRIKTLFDGLQLPDSKEHVTEPPAPDESPMYCLLKNDRLISEVRVSTDLLLRPPKGSGQHDVNDVVLIIEVEIKKSGKFVG